MPAPLIVETDLKEILTEINQKLGTLQKDVTDLKIGQARLEEKVDSIDKRVEKVETSQKNQIWALIGILGTALVGTIIRFVITALPGSNP